MQPSDLETLTEWLGRVTKGNDSYDMPEAMRMLDRMTSEQSAFARALARYIEISIENAVDDAIHDHEWHNHD